MAGVLQAVSNRDADRAAEEEHPSWGAPKIREKLRRLYSEIQLPGISTVHAVLDRHGLVNKGRRRRYPPQGTGLSHLHSPTISGALITKARSGSRIGVTHETGAWNARRIPSR